MTDVKSPSGKRTHSPRGAARPPLAERVVQSIVDYRLPLAALMLIISIVLGYIGHARYLADIGEQDTFWDILYYTLRLLNPAAFPLHGPLNMEIQLARFLSMAAMVYIAAEALLTIFRDQVQQIRLQLIKNHIIICGLGEKGLLLADRYREKRQQVVVIEKEKSNPQIGHCLDRGMVVLNGDAADIRMLNKARIDRARVIISTCGSNHTNAEVALNSRYLSTGRKGSTLSCLVHIINLHLWSLLKEREFRMGIVDSFRLGFFNIFESGARTMLYNFPAFSDTPGETAIPDVLIIGMGHLGESLAANAARRWRYSPRCIEGRLQITILDHDANSKREMLLLNFPHIEKACDLISLQIDPKSLEFLQGSFLLDSGGSCRFSIIYICTPDESAAMAAALRIQQLLHKENIPIIVRMKHSAGLGSLMESGEGSNPDTRNIQVFPLLEDTCTPERISGGSTIWILARAFHNDYIRNAVKRGDTPGTNPSMVPWEKLSDNLKESNRNQAEHVISKLRQFGYDFSMTSEWEFQPLRFPSKEIEEMAMIEHTRFVDERLRAGWKYGAPKDDIKKISPTLVPWDHLSEEEKDKDRNPVIAIPEFLARAGFKVFRSRQH